MREAVYAAGAVLFLAAAGGVAALFLWVPPPVVPAGADWDVSAVVLGLLLASIACWISALGVDVTFGGDGGEEEDSGERRADGYENSELPHRGQAV